MSHVSSHAASHSYSTSSSSFSSPPALTITSQRQSSLASVPFGHYQDYSRAFSENTAYDNCPISSAAPSLRPSSITSGTLSRALGSKFLNVLTENVRSPSTAPGISRKRSLHQRAISLASFVPSLPALSAEENTPVHAHSTSPRGIRRPSSAHFEETLDEDQAYDNPIMEYQSSLSGGVRPIRHVRSPEQSANTSRPTLTQASFRKWFGGSKRGSSPWPMDPSLKRADVHQSAMSLLCPSGEPNLQDSAALSEFLKNAEALVVRLQNTCREQEAEMKAARRERELASEQAKEADTRALHLKHQLEEMDRRASEQQRTCNSLAEELAMEKSRRAEDMDRAHRERRTMTGETDTPHMTRQYHSRPSVDGSTSMSSMASDSGFESDYPDTEADGTNDSMSLGRKCAVQRYEQWDARSNHSGRPASKGSLREGPRQVDSAVWSWMQQEKRRLEQRVQELEGIVDSCLDLVSHV